MPLDLDLLLLLLSLELELLELLEDLLRLRRFRSGERRLERDLLRCNMEGVRGVELQHGEGTR